MPPASCTAAKPSRRGQVLRDVHEGAHGHDDEREPDRDAGVRLGALGVPHDAHREPEQQDGDRDAREAERPRDDAVDDLAERALDAPPLARRDDDREGDEGERDAVAPVCRVQVSCSSSDGAHERSHAVRGAEPDPRTARTGHGGPAAGRRAGRALEEEDRPRPVPARDVPRAEDEPPRAAVRGAGVRLLAVRRACGDVRVAIVVLTYLRGTTAPGTPGRVSPRDRGPVRSHRPGPTRTSGGPMDEPAGSQRADDDATTDAAFPHPRDLVEVRPGSGWPPRRSGRRRRRSWSRPTAKRSSSTPRSRSRRSRRWPGPCTARAGA